MKWFPTNWSSEPGLAMCEAATRGIWIDAINAMMLNNTDHISGTVEQLSRICRCRPSQMDLAVAEIKNFGIGEVSEQNGCITVACRRLSRAVDLSHKRSFAASSRQQTDNNKGARSASASYSDLPEGMQGEGFKAAWAEWHEHRRQKRKPMTELSQKKLLGECARMGEKRAIAAINHSIANGWQGIFEPKNDGQRPFQKLIPTHSQPIPAEKPVTAEELKTRAVVARQMREFTKTIADAKRIE